MYDLIIIGAGPSGLGASIYASRYKLKHVVIGEEIGGQVVEAFEIENYAGIESISGRDLMDKFRKQTEDLGGTIIQAVVKKVTKTAEGFEVLTEDGPPRVDEQGVSRVEAGKKYEAKTIDFALGMKPRKMNIPGEDKFIGKGISYCATCDAMFFRGKDVVVIGGGDAAATAAIHLAEFANSVQMLYKGGTKCYEPSWDEDISKTGKICCGSFEKIDELVGEEKVEGLVYETEDGQKKELKVQGVFIEIGSVPGVVVAKEIGVATDEQGYIIVKQDQSTNVENVYASGDVTTGSNKFRQIITAVAEGAVAAGSIYKKIKLTKSSSQK